NIHHIFATEGIENDGRNPTSNMGMGIGIMMHDEAARIKNVLIEDCSIAMTGHTGIRIFGYGNKSGTTYLDDVSIENNHLKHIGGPGMVPGRCENVVVRGNVVDHSGSSIDPRMHGRGSGIWPWTCNDVLIENNRFMHARGKADSCGAHIDFNCNNVVIQYNLSLDNAGGFVEILGNDNNCCYRYNISINDGFRIKGQNGAVQDGKALWTSGYVGSGNLRKGPFNSYIYNNTIYVKEEIRSGFSFAPTTEGILIANNIFYIPGETVDVSGDNAQSIPSVVFTNNLYLNADILPGSLPITDSDPLTGDPGFQNAGGFEPSDYVPANNDLISNKGIHIEHIPGDNIGLSIGLEVETDFFGNPIEGNPDMGAIEIQSN
ncbi:MAG: right-handed parallel beta-helix repeat-containing protein, partial [Bacteroidales bacterium]|nr:right-handed parallel beta-helix repeat-containing protein [Bacteroidales bacterium]